MSQLTLFPHPTTTLPTTPGATTTLTMDTHYVVVYHGSKTDYHGVFTLAAWYPHTTTRVTLTDWWGNTLHNVRRGSIDVITLPKLTSAQKSAMILLGIVPLRRRPVCGLTGAPVTDRMMAALERLGMVEATDEVEDYPAGYRLTRVGLEVARHLERTWWG